MEKFKVSFEANNQQLKALGTKHASDTYADIEATFVLGEKWTDMDSVSAVWWNDFTRIATVLDSQGKCIVPHEVLTRKGCVRVNLVGSIVEGDELITRLTSYSAEAVQVNEKIKLTGSETSEVTPSQYEQFVANVKSDADRAEAGATASEQSAQSASESATASANSASDSAQSAIASAQSAQNASESAISAESAKDDAEDARDEILGMRATAETLEAGSDATASYSDGLLTLGIPRGDRGEQGIQGETGATPNLTIGTVETLEPTEDATATITGTAEEPVLNLGLPKGDTGDVSQEQLDAAVSDLKSDLSETEIVKDVSFSGAINGQFIATSGNIGSSDTFSYVTNIAVPKGYKIVFTARGYLNTVAMIARYANNAYTPLVESIDSTVRQYEYVATEDMVIALSYNNAYTHSCKLLYEVETQVSAIADSVQKDLTFTHINDYYIYNDGTIIPNESFYYTSPVYIEKGVALYVFARGYSTNVAIISKTNSTNAIHTPLVISEDSVAKWYEVDITESGYYCLCSNKVVPITAYVKIKVGFEDGLEERVSSLEENEIFDLSMFINFGVVGDSYASGEVYYDGGFHDKYENSWGQIMARQSGTTCTNYSAGGLTTKTWLTHSDGLSKVLANDAEDIYYLLLGINDRGYYGESYIGTLNDITDYQSYTDYADSFFGNYGRIIEQIQNHAPYAKLVLFTGTNTSELGVKYNNATIAIANYYGIPCIVQNDDAFFQTSYYADMVNGHPRTVAYSGMAQAFKRLIVKCIADNWDYFKDYYMHA